MISIAPQVVGIESVREVVLRNSIVADEVAVLPGMEELSNLLYIAKYQEEKQYDVVILDTAPTGETLRLLSFPEMPMRCFPEAMAPEVTMTMW